MTLPETLRAVLHVGSGRPGSPCPWDALDGDEQAAYVALAAWVEADRARVASEERRACWMIVTTGPMLTTDIQEATYGQRLLLDRATAIRALNPETKEAE